MKRVYVDEKWCLGCHLCEYYCAFANSGKSSMIKALKDRTIHPRIRIEGDNQVSFAVSCRHCTDPLCVKSCIAGALSKKDGVVCIDQNKCVGLPHLRAGMSLRRADALGIRRHAEVRAVHRKRRRQARLCAGLSEQSHHL